MTSELPTVGEALRWASDRLLSAGVDSPAVDAEILLGHVLKLRRLDLHLSANRLTTSDERDRLRDVLSHRCERTPLQYLTGETEFWSLPMFVSPAVLIPRPETEVLVETAAARLRGLRRPTVADVGTGSGCIAVSLARDLPDCRILGIDLSPAALAVARANAHRHGLRDRVRFVACDLLEALPALPGLDAVVANPPYIPTGQIPGLQPEVRDHEPRLALDGGSDGLHTFRRLVADSWRRLRPGGWLVMEVGDGQMDPVCGLIRAAGGFEEPERRTDLAGVSRVVAARRQGEVAAGPGQDFV